jgi:hypothetical protein
MFSAPRPNSAPPRHRSATELATAPPAGGPLHLVAGEPHGGLDVIANAWKALEAGLDVVARLVAVDRHLVGETAPSLPQLSDPCTLAGQFEHCAPFHALGEVNDILPKNEKSRHLFEQRAFVDAWRHEEANKAGVAEGDIFCAISSNSPVGGDDNPSVSRLNSPIHCLSLTPLPNL